MSHDPERLRLIEHNNKLRNWKKWGPYLADRQWGTVREDYSDSGDAWDYFTHDQARSRAYRWGEDGIGGISDEKQYLCFAPSFWNGKDPILKERFFGLSGKEGNHGEDVKESYYYIDNTPTHSYMKMLYQYPQQAFPYSRIVDENLARTRSEPEYELQDTGIFDENRYFNIFIEYAKHQESDMLIRITVINKGPEAAALHIIPQIWFRNTWSWDNSPDKPGLRLKGLSSVIAEHFGAGKHFLFAEGTPEIIFCENETNYSRINGTPRTKGYYKDGINDYLVNRDKEAVNPQNTGTKAGFCYYYSLDPGHAEIIRLRLAADPLPDPFQGFDSIIEERISEADLFYDSIQAVVKDGDARSVQRQALAGLLWNKQFYHFNIPEWLSGDPAQPAPPESRRSGRNSGWEHLHNSDIISMPDKWEYPWYASWDLAFHCIPLEMVDPAFSKEQLRLLVREWYMHPNGQLPAYEWNFSDVNPPVHAWATWRIYKMDKKMQNGRGDRDFLETVFHKLLLNFTWWVNRKDEHNRNIFQGGFLGLDNIGVFDRSSKIPGGGHIEQADATAWMAMYSLNMMRIALELSVANHVYENLASKFLEHFLYIAGAMTNIGGKGIGLWDEEDQFFYDVLYANGTVQLLKARSLVGLIPLFAVEVIEPDIIHTSPEFARRTEWFLKNRPDLAGLVSRWFTDGEGERRLFSLLRGHRLKRILKRMLDENEFLSDFGIRSVSKYHENHPFVLTAQDAVYKVDYQPGESTIGLFGGNSNWRGPVWFPVNFLIIESLQRFYHYYGPDFKVECPTDSGNYLTLEEIASFLSDRLSSLFLKDKQGKRPVDGGLNKEPNDAQEHYILFHEYFHGDTGKGLGASHQTGWTGLIAKLLQEKHL